MRAIFQWKACLPLDWFFCGVHWRRKRLHGKLSLDKVPRSRMKEYDHLPPAASTLTTQGMRVFEAVARHCNFSRAASELRVSQPYVSNRISDLENELHISLFRRVGRRAYLTEAGELLYSHIQRILTSIRDAENSVAQLRQVIVGRLDLAAGIIVAESILPPLLVKLRTRYPEISLNLRVYNSKQVEDAVADGQFELGVSLSHELPKHLDAEEFARDELVLVLSADHPLAQEPFCTPEQLIREPLLLREGTSGTRLFVESSLSSLGLTVQPTMELNSNQAIKALVEHNLGVAILSTRAVRNEVSSGRLKTIPVKGVDLRRPLTLVWRKGHELSPPAAAFRAMVRSPENLQ